MSEPTNTTEPTNTAEPKIVEEQKPAAEVVPIDPLASVKAALTAEEKEAFFKSFLSDKSYIGEASLFHGKVKLKFSALSVKQNNAILTQLQYDRNNDVAHINDEYILRVIQYRVASALVEVDGIPFAPDITEDSIPHDTKLGTTYLVKRLDIFKSWSIHKMAAITEAYGKFEKKLNALTEESFNGDF